MPPVAADLLTSLLREVSRSFYLTLWILPRPVRRPIGLAYLLARATDTIADSEWVPVTERLGALDALRDRILGRRMEPLDFSRLAAGQVNPSKLVNPVTPAEGVLLRRVEEAIAALEGMPDADAAEIRGVLTTITGGQELDLRRFGQVRPGDVRALATAAELDDYTYRVAGCVGEFWTRICRTHLYPSLALDDGKMRADGVKLGQGLQLVNILRDLPRDLRTGRCYMPADALARMGLVPADLLKPENEARVWPLYSEWVIRAESHLAAGWAYVTALPRGQVRMRLACAWPVLLGVMTLQRLKAGGVLDPSRRIKVSRSDVRAVMWATVWRLMFGRAWDRLDAWARSR